MSHRTAHGLGAGTAVLGPSAIIELGCGDAVKRTIAVFCKIDVLVTNAVCQKNRTTQVEPTIR